MKAIVCTKYGSPEVLQLQEVEKPTPKQDEVLVKVHAAMVTTAGLISRTGKPMFTRLFSGLTKPKHSIPGMELAGQIEAVGSHVKSFKEGEQIFGLAGMTLGANSEYICLSEKAAILKKPMNLNYEESASVIEGGLTALHFLRNKGKIRSGQKVLIYAASGSVGTASIQIAKHFDTEVTGVCSNGNMKLVTSLGADHVIDYTKEDFTKNSETYDIIFDTLGKRSFLECKNSLEPNGIYLDAAGLSTIFLMLWTSIFSSKKAILTTTYTRSKIKIKHDLITLKELVEVGAIKPVIDKRYPLEQTADAHRYVETGRKKGNVVINIK